MNPEHAATEASAAEGGFDPALFDALGVDELVPAPLAAWRPLVVEALGFFLDRLPPQRLEAIVADQFALPEGHLDPVPDQVAHRAQVDPFRGQVIEQPRQRHRQCHPQDGGTGADRVLPRGVWIRRHPTRDQGEDLAAIAARTVMKYAQTPTSKGIRALSTRIVDKPVHGGRRSATDCGTASVGASLVKKSPKNIIRINSTTYA